MRLTISFSKNQVKMPQPSHRVFTRLDCAKSTYKRNIFHPRFIIKVSSSPYTLKEDILLFRLSWGFPGHPVVENPTANTGDTCSIPSSGRCHVCQGNH